MLKILTAVTIAVTIAFNTAQAKDNWDKWKQIENNYFRIYSDASEKRVMGMLEELEKFRLLVEMGLVVKVPENAPKPIVLLFKSRSKFGKFKFHRNLSGYVTWLENVPLIVMPVSSRGLDSETVVRHEYVHVAQAYDTRHMPRWVREGLAEMFSTATYHENIGLIGRPNKDRWQYLYREINYDRLVADDFDGLKTRMGADAYAQYWLLTNYSMTHGDGVYRNSFGRYLALYKDGMDSLAAFKQAYGVTPNQLAKEAMKNYRKRSYTYKQLMYPLDYAKMDLEPEISKPPDGLVKRLMERLGIKVKAIKEERKNLTK